MHWARGFVSSDDSGGTAPDSHRLPCFRPNSLNYGPAVHAVTTARQAQRPNVALSDASAEAERFEVGLVEIEVVADLVKQRDLHLVP